MTGIPSAKILLVDDKPDILLLGRLNLEAEGYDVIEASDGQSALAAVARERFLPPVHALANLGITVGESAAGQAQSKVGLGTEQLADPQFGIEIDRRDGRSQGQVGTKKIRLIVIEETIAGDGPATFQ